MSSEISIGCYDGVSVLDTQRGPDGEVVATALVVDGELHEIQWTPQLKDVLFSLAMAGDTNE